MRARAFRAEHYAIADRLPENAFIDLNLRIGKGRTEEEKKRTGEAIFAAAIDVLGPLFETPHFALSLEICEIDAELSRLSLWRTSPLTRVVNAMSSSWAASVKGISHGPIEPVLSKFLPWVTLNFACYPGLVEIPVWVGVTGIPVRWRQSCCLLLQSGVLPCGEHSFLERQRLV